MSHKTASLARRSGVVVMLAGVCLALGAATATASSAEAPDAAKCNGINTNPASGNLTKTVVDGDLTPGSEVTFEVAFPADAEAEPGLFNVLDCAYLDGELVHSDEYAVSNTEPYVYTLTIPADATPGESEYCNHAKTTADPSESPGGNRKAEVCFTVAAPEVEPTEEPSEDPSETPSEEPSEEPSEDPSETPAEVEPTVSPTVLGVKIVQPELTKTGSPSAALTTLGIGLLVIGGGLTFGGTRYRKQH